MTEWLRKSIAAITLIAISCVAFADPPPASGVVVRFEAPAAYTWFDPESGLRVIVGADVDEFCAGNLNFDIVEWQDVNLADGRTLTNGNGVMQATVWDFLEFDCDLFTTVDPVASGYARFRYVDNDIFGIAEGDRNANSWTFMANGKLEDPWGSRVILKATLHQLLGNNTGYKIVADVQLH
jgi:hypothetical protein